MFLMRLAAARCEAAAAGAARGGEEQQRAESFMGRAVNFYHNESAGSHAVVSRPSTGDRRKVPAK